MNSGIPASVMPWIHGVTQHPLGKRSLRLTRQLTVRLLGVARQVEFMRRALRLPTNQVVDPLADTGTAGLRTVRLAPPRYFRRALPHVTEDPALRPYFAARLKEYSEPQYVAVLAGGSVWGCAQGAVFTQQGHFVPSLTRDPWGPMLHQVWTRVRLPRLQAVRGRVLNLVTAEASDNYHHWLIDLLPRIGMAQRAGYPIESFDRILLNHADRRYQRETLEAIGVDPAKILLISPSQRVQADELVVPSIKQNNEHIPADHVKFLRERLLPSDARPGTRRIFLSRRDARTRRLLNEDEIFSALKPLGFESVLVCDLSVKDQARLFASAEFIAGPSGAAFANLVFASSGCGVVELAAPSWLTAYHWMISARRGLTHSVVLADGEAPPQTLNISGRASDFALDPAKVQRTVSSILQLKALSRATNSASFKAPRPQTDRAALRN